MDSESENSLFGILLAAGASTRMGEQNKLLSMVDGQPLISRSLGALAEVCPVIIVTGWQSAAVENAVTKSQIPVRFVDNPQYQDGMSSSLKAGLNALPPGATGCFIAPADMPNIRAKSLQRMRNMHRTTPASIIAPYAGTRQGNPVLWPRRFFDILMTLDGDRGAKALLQGALRNSVQPIQVSEAELFDIDTAQDLRKFTQ